MPRTGTKRHRLVRRLLWATVAVVLVFALLPVWFPWVLKPVLSRFHLRITNYHRTGYTRFTLGGVTGEWNNSRLNVGRIESILPNAWLWRKFTERTKGPPWIIVRDGDLVITPSSAESPRTDTAKRTESLDDALDQTARIARLLRGTLPVAELTNCSIQIASNRFAIPHADWHGGRLSGVVDLPDSRGRFDVAGSIDKTSSLQLRVKSSAYEVSFDSEFSKSSAGWDWDGEANWLTNRAEFNAQFSTNGWWPVHAELRCPDFEIPASKVRLPSYENLNGTLTANLTSNQFSLQATGFTQSASFPGTKGLPPLEVSLAANGDQESVSIHKFNVQSPFLTATLTNTVGYTWRGGLLANPAQFQIASDLGKLPGTNLTGQVQGFGRIETHGRQPPTAEFELTATNLRAWHVNAESALVKGEFTTPVMRLAEFTVNFADRSKLAASGDFDFPSRQILNGKWKASGGLITNIFPAVNGGTIDGSGIVSGPLTNLVHRGAVKIAGFRSGRLNALNVDAEWSGRNLRLDSVYLALGAGQSVLSAGGAVDLSALKRRRASLTLTNLFLRRSDGTELYALQNPCAISFSADRNRTETDEWKLAIDDFNWQGTNRDLSLSADVMWPEVGNVRAAITNVAFSDFSDFLTNDIGNISLVAFDLAAGWSNGPIRSRIFTVATLTNQDGQDFTLRSSLTANEALSIEHLVLENSLMPTLSVTGSIPVRIVLPRRAGLLDWEKAKAIAMAGSWEDNSGQKMVLPLAEHEELNVVKPDLQFAISGTPENPLASLRLNVAAISWQPPTNNLPPLRLEDLSLNMEVQPQQIKLDRLTASLDGQLIQAEGNWPLAADAWREMWLQKTLPNWSRAQGSLQLESAQLAAVSRYVPQLLAPEGQLGASLELKPGKHIQGALTLTNASTRSFGKMTPLRDISANVRLDGHRAELKNFQGQIGGQPVQADGYVTLPASGGLEYNVHLRGTNVPLVRSLELLLRGDFDIQLHGKSNSPPQLAGKLNLHDGLFLQHASALVWSGPKRPELLPPYFSITNRPMADWRMDLAISGDRCLRVRTPVFSGILSANLKLNGPLRNPVLTGDVRANNGRVNFPFGALNVNQAYASFSGNDLQGPELQISASGRNYNYDTHIEVNGPAAGANVTFSSTPPLASEQILLMLTAGEVPTSDYSYSSSARVGRLATYFGKDFISRFTGNDQAEERLILHTGEGISEEGRLTYSVEYRLTDRWSIIGEYDEFNAFNADLKWKVFER